MSNETKKNNLVFQVVSWHWHDNFKNEHLHASIIRKILKKDGFKREQTHEGLKP
jgi:hypothetical protein